MWEGGGGNPDEAQRLRKHVSAPSMQSSSTAIVILQSADHTPIYLHEYFLGGLKKLPVGGDKYKTWTLDSGLNDGLDI